MCRGISTESGEWVYGYYYRGPSGNEIWDLTDYIVISADDGTFDTVHEIKPNTVSRFTTCYDKNNKPIFAGDVLKERRPERDSQTHYGDNIPLGQYIEPLEPIINEYYHVVIDEGVGFILDGDDSDEYRELPIHWINFKYDLELSKEGFSCMMGYDNSKRWIWDTPDGDSDLSYLLKEYGYESEAELVGSLGIEIVGDVYTTEEYKDWIE